jgi:hypothetical protein
VFKDRLRVELQDLGRANKLYYTTDGSQPSSNSARFVKAFGIDRDTTVKAIAINELGNRSAVVTAIFHRMPHDWKLTLSSDYSSQYTGGGNAALVDGLRGTTNWTSGAWQGYWERDLVAVVDLGSVQQVSKVGAGFLQDTGSWIWFPRRLEIELSLDGKNFTRVATIESANGSNGSASVDGATIKDFTQTIAPQNARYVRLRAVNAGKKTWIFADEILIEK